MPSPWIVTEAFSSIKHPWVIWRMSGCATVCHVSKSGQIIHYKTKLAALHVADKLNGGNPPLLNKYR